MQGGNGLGRSGLWLNNQNLPLISCSVSRGSIVGVF